VRNPEEHLHRELLEYLTRIDGRLGEICEDSPDGGPEEILAELGHATAGTRETVDRLVAAIHDAHAPIADLNSIMVATSRDLLADTGFPVVVKISTDESLPPLRHPPEAVRAMVRRALQLSVEHVGPGGMLRVATQRVNGHAELRIEARGTPTSVATMSIDLRSASLADVLTGIGGGLSLTQDFDQLSFKLAFSASVGIH
jgi:hypothetical protein